MSAQLSPSPLTINWTVRLWQRCLGALLSILLLNSTQAIAEDWLHTVRPGDTFWSLCLELTNQPGCWQSLPQYNSHVENPRALPQGSLIKIPVEWLKAPPAPAAVELVRGDAKLIRRQGNSKRIQPGRQLESGENYLQTDTNSVETALRAGTDLYMGDKIVTGEGNVLLRFADNSSFLIKSNSELLLERLSAHKQTGMVDTHMRLNHGSGRATVNSQTGKSRYQISTPAAIAAARGTDFSVSAEPPLILVNEVLEGEVLVSNSEGEQAVEQGYGTVAEANKPPIPPVKLLAAPQIALEANTTLPFVLNWSAVEGASTYNVDLYAGNDRKNLIRSYRSNTNELDFPALTSNTYTFVVRAIDQLGLQGLEAIASTDAVVNLATPNLSHEKILVDGEKVSLQWPAIEQATSYRVQIATDKLFGTIVKQLESEKPQADLMLPEGKTYFVRVQAIYPHHGAGGFSATQQFSSKVRDLWLILLQALGILAVVI